MDYEVDVITVTWNKKEMVKSFVESLSGGTSTSCRLIIVDNASSDGTVDYLMSLKDTRNCKFKLVLNKVNKGFVGGVAQGVEISDAPYVCWANNDLIFCEGWLEEILSILKNNDKIGVVSPNSNSLGVYPDQGLSLPDFAAGLRKKYSGVFVEMPFCVGFCLVVKREVIDKIGGLSADFAPGYFEDTDYSMAAKKAGYLIGFAKAAYVWHHEHVSFKQVKKKQEEAFSKNLDKFNRKWGRILRIACFADNYQEVFVSLAAGVELTRQGNYITFYVKDTDIRREEIFRACNLFENTGIQFKRSGNPIFVMVKIVFKKKRFDLIICRGFLKFFFRFMGYRVSDRFDQELAASIKSCVQ